LKLVPRLGVDAALRLHLIDLYLGRMNGDEVGATGA
jgi:hypothetical protein